MPSVPATGGACPSSDAATSACLSGLVAAARPYLWESSATPARALPANAFATSDVIELYHLRYEEVDANGLSRQVVQRVFYLRTRLGAQLFAPDDFWYDSSRWSFHLSFANVIHADGTHVAGSDAGDDDPRGLGNRARGLSLPRLQPGDVIDVVYTLTPVDADSWQQLGGGYLGDLFAFKGTYPAERVEYVLRAHRAMAVEGVGLAPAREMAGPDTWRSWIWTAGPLAAYWPDDDGPSITDSSPYVQTGSFNSWSGLASWYRTRLNDRAQLTPAFRAELLRRVPPKTTAVATVAAVWAYLARHLDYAGNETGVHGFWPSPPQTVLRAGQGDCKDGALLLATWLDIEGVPADLALVRTWRMGSVGDGAATLAAFDHAITYVPELNLWIDTTAPSLPLGQLPVSDQGGTALIVAAGQDRLTPIPVAPASANATVRNLWLTPRGPGQWQMTGALEATGTAAETWREELAGERGAVTTWVRRSFPHARLLGSSAREAGGAVQIRFRAVVSRADLTQAVALFPHRYTPLLAAEPERSDAKHLPSRWQVTERWALQVGRCAGPTPATPPELASPFGSLRVRRQCQNGWLITTTELQQSASEVAATAYPRFRQFWQAVDTTLNPPSQMPVQVAARDSHPAAANGALASSASSPGKE